MEPSRVNPLELLVEIIQEHAPEDIWHGSPLIACRLLQNTNRGEIGEEFVRRYLRVSGIEVGNDGRTSKTDLRIGSSSFEVKTASLGANGTFQFNHVRLDRDYDWLLCLGICPFEIVQHVAKRTRRRETRRGVGSDGRGAGCNIQTDEETQRHESHSRLAGGDPRQRKYIIPKTFKEEKDESIPRKSKDEGTVSRPGQGSP